MFLTITGGPGVHRLDIAKKLSAKQDDTVVISAGQLLRSAVSNGKMAPDVSQMRERRTLKISNIYTFSTEYFVICGTTFTYVMVTYMYH